MAFKREGDDGSWLNSLKNRRVAELFAENIPEGEAYLMKNGRFACLVCSHRPIFDTVLMLARHREGKKHAASVEYKAIEDEELRQLRRKRQHEELVKTGKIPSELKLMEEQDYRHTTGNNATSLLGSAPYDPRHKRTRSKPDQRKPVLDLSSVAPQVAVPEATSIHSLPGNNDYNASTSDIILDAEKNTWNSFQDNLDKKKPKHSQKAARPTGKRVINPINPVTGRKLYTTTNQLKKLYSGDSNFSKPSQTIADHRKTQASIAREEHLLANFRPYQRKRPKTSNESSSSAVPVTKSGSKSLQTQDQSSRSDSGAQAKDKSTPGKQPTPEFIQGFASGYIKDKFGKWVRDENAEFDSDDDSS